VENFSFGKSGAQDKYDPILGMSMREFKPKEGMDATKQRESNMRSKIQNLKMQKAQRDAETTKAKAKKRIAGVLAGGRDILSETMAATKENRNVGKNLPGAGIDYVKNKTWDRL